MHNNIFYSECVPRISGTSRIVVGSLVRDGVLTPEQAAEPIIDILLSPPNKQHPMGQLLQYGKILPWL